MSVNNNNIIKNSSYLSKAEVKKVLPYAATSSASVNNDESWINPLKLNLLSPAAKKFPISSTSLKAHDKCFFDTSSGLKISLVEGRKEVIIAFGARGSGNTEVPIEQQQRISDVQLRTGIFNLLGTNCDIYEQASKFVEEFTKLPEFKDKRIVIVGQSLGGSLAQYAGLKNQLTTYCFNPVPLGRAQIKKLKADGKIKDHKIIVVSVEGDYATLLAENRLSKVAQWVIESPALYGRKFTIPSAYQSPIDTHTYFMGSLMKYLGYDIRTKIDALPLHEICIANNEEMLDHAIANLKQSIHDLCELKTSLNENNSDKCSKQLQLIKNNSPWIFNYLGFITWLANEGRDFGDRNYGEHRLLEMPLILKKITVGNIPFLDLLIEHYSVLLFFQNAKKSFLSISEKTEQISQNLLSYPTIYQEKEELVIGLRALLNSAHLMKETNIFDPKALHLLSELNEELQSTKGDSGKLKKILEEISSNHPKVYFSILLLFKQQMNQPTLKNEIVSQLIHANPTVLIRLFNGKQNILMQLIECMECIQALHTATDNLVRVKNFLLGHYHYASNVTDHLVFGDLDSLYQKIEELETAFSLINDQQRLLNSFKERFDYLDVSSKEAIKPDRIKEQISGAKRIYMVAAECTGIIKVGGLAEAVRGIAEGLNERGHQVTLIMPKYSTFPQDRKGEVKDSLELAPVEIKHSFGNVTKVDRIFSSKMNGINMLFIEDTVVPGQSDRDRFALEGNSLYEFPSDPDEVQMKGRFAYFGQAAAELIKELKEQIDVVFFHDWHSALAIPLLARNSTTQWIERSIPPLVYVFHNNGYSAQGMLNDRQHRSILSDLKLPTQFFNMTEQAVSIADHVCTVSESYALEVQGREGNGLQREMRRAAHKFSGVTNGCNLSLWNPYTEKQLVNWIDPITQEPAPIHFDHTGDILQNKWCVKQQLQRWLFQYHPEIIDQYGIDMTRDNVILWVNRFDSSQKGVDKLRFAMQVAKEKGATFIVMGVKEDPTASQLLDELEKEAAALKDPSWGGAWIIRDSVNELGLLNFQQGTKEGVPGIGHLARAAANICFCSSEYEPCGLTHLEGFAFAQLTVASNLGGYADIICEDTQSPLFNGFLFPRYPNWKSDEQNQAVVKRMGQAIDYWNSLSNEQKNAVMNNLIQVSKQYSWTTSPHGLTPIEKYEKVIAAAEKTSQSRGASERLSPLLLSESVKASNNIIINNN